MRFNKVELCIGEFDLDFGFGVKDSNFGIFLLNPVSEWRIVKLAKLICPVN